MSMLDKNNVLFTGIIAMVLISLVTGIYLISSAPAETVEERNTAMFMFTSDIEKNITETPATIKVPFYIENHEGRDIEYRYSIDLFLKDGFFHQSLDKKDAWTEDLNVGQIFNAASGSVYVRDGEIQKVECEVPFSYDGLWKYSNITLGDDDWKYMNITIKLYKDGSDEIYRSLKLWALNKI
ncbi:hypothetical protein CUJ83_03720 [Methanocella sp. CWC-04]|uniref:Uncharacterized protein n=1 Tax=Methanooceanicella nereidis TaxID=2052831 RepID=A0AAP2W5E4_9EURY|nr:DUF1616 domain-containing protein [Methanocella sp. CWC-04]MCD1294102.1 hypothetical protein [Methanocella sp. CWC-04]